MGEYPHRGDYVCLIPLYEKKFVGKEIVFDAFPLTIQLLTHLMGAIRTAKEMTFWERKRAMEEIDRKKKEAHDKKCQDAYKDGTPAFGGADFSSSVNRERMLANIRANRNPISYQEIKQRMGSGHQQVNL